MRCKFGFRRITALLLCVVMALTLSLPAAAAGIRYMPGVTAEMSDASYWVDLYEDAQEIILTAEEIKAFNEDTYIASGTMVMDLRTISETFDGPARIEMVQKSSTADAEYYYGWIYSPDGKIADWSYFQNMIDNCVDPNVKATMPIRYAVAVERTTLQVFPSDDPLWDDPKDLDFNYQHLSAVQVNDPLVIYLTSADGKYYMARSRDCSGWIPAEDVAICADREEWLSAWVIPEEKTLVVYGNKEYTDESFTAPETARRMLAQGTKLELVTDLEPDQLVNNRYTYHNYVVYLPVRREDGSYEKKMALIPETAKVNVGFLPLTTENIAMVTLQNLGDAYGWGGMMGVEDCSGMVRTVYACFGLEIGRNGNWQWNMNIEKIDMNNMSIEEKCAILDELPLGAALSFPGHEMIYLGKVDGKYYVISTVSSIMSPDTGKRLRTRDVMINTLDVKRANGLTWLQALDMAFMPCYAKLEGKTYDFPETKWYREGLNYVIKKGLIANYGDGYFGPNDVASREVTVNALWRIDGRPEVENTDRFTDVFSETHKVSAIAWADANGIAIGYGDGKFGPEDALTREQMVTILWRYAQYKGYDVSAGEEVNILSYDDTFKISEYAIPAMQWACASGLIEGENDTYGQGMVLDPKNSATRAQLSMVLLRFDEWMKQAIVVAEEE
ncbi:MAG: SH3 domain-containing protein [Oscillospiraceae bacterium]|nr:SH3 domain-containing protein [Oscillospiraceae bacterium]